jgi:SAM-dependent methyltransferase
MKKLYSINTSELVNGYQNFGVDITRFVSEHDSVTLYEDEDGIRRWDPLIPGDGKFYDEISRNNHWYYSQNRAEFDIASLYIENGPILEVGCGEGHFPIGRNFSNYVGLEINEDAVIKARNRGLNVACDTFQNYSNNNPSSFQYVISFQLLEHLPDPEDYFKSAFKLLFQEGLLITAVPCEDSFCGAIKSNYLNSPPHHMTKWTEKCLKKYPEKYGFFCVDIIKIPVEPIHSHWFYKTLFNIVLNNNEKYQGIAGALKKSLIKKFLFKESRNWSVPGELFIPGHTMIAIHKKK